MQNSIQMSNTVFYIVVFVIIAHFLVGFIFLVRKLSGPVAKEPVEDPSVEVEESIKDAQT